MLNGRLIYIFSLLSLSISYSKVALSSTPRIAQTENPIKGTPPTITENVQFNRFYLKNGDTTLYQLLDRESVEIPSSSNSSNITLLIDPPLNFDNSNDQGDYYDTDGDEGEIVKKVMKIEWLDSESNVIALDPNTAIGEQKITPHKMRTTIELQAISFYGLPKQGESRLFEKAYDVVIVRPDGTFDNPAKSCLAIHTQYPQFSDGEYWLGSTTDKVKTFCDMRNGGYTLIWSYSEKTAYSIYNNNRMMMYGRTYTFSNSLEINLVTSETGVINYKNYRFGLPRMKQLKDAKPASYRVRIAYNPTNTDDPWGNDNYFDARPSSTKFDYIDGSTTYSSKPDDVVTSGKIFGLDFSSDSNGYYYNGAVSGRVNPYINQSLYPAHWDAQYRITSDPKKLYNVTIPRADGGGVTYKIKPENFNNLFGFHGESEVNHHFGKCGGDDYNFDTEYCYYTRRVPHSFNDGEGRYLQWYIK